MQTEINVDEMSAGKELDTLIAERVLGWQRVQAPQFDYDGPLPEQGEVLVSPTLLSAIRSNEYQWPPKGIIPFDAFVSKKYSTKIEDAWPLTEGLKLFSIGQRNDGTWSAWCWNRTHINAKADTAPLAICKLLLKTAAHVRCEPNTTQSGENHE